MGRKAIILLGTALLSGCYPVFDTVDAPAEETVAVVAPATETAPEPVDPVTEAPDEPEGPRDPEEPVTPEDPEEPVDPTSKKPTKTEAARFLVQASFGPAPSDVDAVVADGLARWIEKQAALPVRTYTERTAGLPAAPPTLATDFFWEAAVEAPDQLRQRVAFALSQIVVVSTQDRVVTKTPLAYPGYMDVLQRQALGNYEDLIREVTFTPAMGRYLSYLGNRASDPETGAAPDENYARELMQLFTIGLVELTPGGEPTEEETYTAEDVAGLAKVFTGLSWANTRFDKPRVSREAMMSPMVGYPAYHEPGEKTFLGHTVPGGLTPEESVDNALSHLLAHPNVAPFVTRQLIQRLITSNPTPAYVERAANAYKTGRFESGGHSFGTGRRGDMTATVAAILLDPEARDTAATERPDYGKVREPILRLAHWARVFRDGKGASFAGAPPVTNSLRWADSAKSLGQRAYGPDSVFGFTRPGYVAPGSWTAGSDLAAPQLALSSGATVIGYVNMMKRFIREGEGREPDFFDPDYRRYTRLADDPERLVDKLDEVLTYGMLDPATKDRIVDALRAVPEGEVETPTNRVHLAVLMLVTTPEYAVQR